MMNNLAHEPFSTIQRLSFIGGLVATRTCDAKGSGATTTLTLKPASMQSTAIRYEHTEKHHPFLLRELLRSTSIAGKYNC